MQSNIFSSVLNGQFNENQVWLRRFPRHSIVTSLRIFSIGRFLDENVKSVTLLKRRPVFFSEWSDLLNCDQTFLRVMPIFFNDFFSLCPKSLVTIKKTEKHLKRSGYSEKKRLHFKKVADLTFSSKNQSIFDKWKKIYWGSGEPSQPILIFILGHE